MFGETGFVWVVSCYAWCFRSAGSRFRDDDDDDGVSFFGTEYEPDGGIVDLVDLVDLYSQPDQKRIKTGHGI